MTAFEPARQTDEAFRTARGDGGRIRAPALVEVTCPVPDVGWQGIEVRSAEAYR